MGGDQEIVDIFGVNFSGDSDVVAGRASVAENSALVGSGPHETKDSRVDGRGGGPQVVEGKVGFGVGDNFGDVESRGGVAADSNNGSGGELGRRKKIVVRWGWCVGGAKGTDIDHGTLKSSLGTFFFHFIGGRRNDFGDAAGSAPSNDVVGSPSGT